MCFKFMTNFVYGIIISILILALCVFIILISITSVVIKKPLCKLDENTSGVCINATFCAIDTRKYIQDDCSDIDGFTCCLADDVIDESERKFSAHKNFKFFNSARCGIVDEDKSFDYVVDLGYENENREVNFTCGGSFITKKFILTSASCVFGSETGYNVSLIRLKHEKYCRDDSEDCSYIINFEVIPHPEYDPEDLTNDIALIKLKNSDSKVTPVCLPFGVDKVPSEMSRIGINDEESNSYFISLPDCYASAKNFNSSKIELRPLYEEVQFCAQMNDANHNCNVEHGLPLHKSTIIRGKNRIVQFGISSYDFKYCQLPGVYTKTYSYLDWILENVDE